MHTGTTIAAAAVVVAAFAASPANAHHAIGSVVDTTKTQQSMMVLTKVDWINPHAWFHFSMTKTDGSVIKDVAVEWQGIAGLRQRGYTGPEAFPVGRTYSVAYYPNRDGSPGGHLVSMVDQSTNTVVGRAPDPAPFVPPLPQPRPRYSLTGDE